MPDAGGQGGGGGGCSACLTQWDQFGAFGKKKTHGYIRVAEPPSKSIPRNETIHEREEHAPLMSSQLPAEDPNLGDSQSREVAVDVKEAGQGDVEVENIFLLRPPRDGCEICRAALCALLGACLGAFVGFYGLCQKPAMLMSQRCETIGPISEMGFDAMHPSKLMLSLYCRTVRPSLAFKVAAPLLVSAAGAYGGLRLAYGRAYIEQWNDEESIIELKKLYSLRSCGSKFVLMCWWLRHSSIFGFQVIVEAWLRYTVDLGMDLQVMGIFLQHHQFWFFSLNLLGIIMGLLWTAHEFYLRFTEPGAEITHAEVFFAGMTLPLLGQHVTYLSVLSLLRGSLHPLLFVSTVAEAILESSFSCFIQTYAVVFTELPPEQKSELYFSVFMSFLSIGYAFSTIDMVQGGRILVKIPGFCKSVISPRFCVVFVFRICEITSRATSLALFQAVTRPYGMFLLIAVDALIISCVTVLFQWCCVVKFAPIPPFTFFRQNFFFVIPSVLCCHMAPILEKDSAISVPPWVYYSIRLLELGGMVAVAGKWLDWKLDAARQLFADDGFIVASFAISTLLMLVLVVIIRTCLSVRSLVDSPADVWSNNEFNPVQHALKNRILEVKSEWPDQEQTTEAVSILLKELQRHPKLTSKECVEHVQQNMKGVSGRWNRGSRDLIILRARASYSIKEAMHDLENYDFAKVASSLQTESLVSISSSQGVYLTAEGNQIVGKKCSDSSNQKFVLEATDSEDPQTLKLKCLESGQLLGLEKDGFKGEGLEESEATLFAQQDAQEMVHTAKAGVEVFLHHAGRLTTAPMSMVQSDGKEAVEAWRLRFVEDQRYAGMTFRLKQAKYCSQDDAGVFKWAAGEITKLAASVQRQQSFAEKYRTLVVVACNARTVDVEVESGILEQDPELHQNMLCRLLQPFRNEKEIRISVEELGKSVEVGRKERKLVAKKEVESYLARAGIQPGDKLLMFKLLGEDASVKIDEFEQMRQLLTDVKKSSDTAIATFLSEAYAKTEESKQTIKKAVEQTESIAALLPTWQEITKRAEKLGVETVLRPNFLFRVKCELVKGLTSAGFHLHHKGFVQLAMHLHYRFNPLPKQKLPKRFDAVVEDVLIAQLEVLVSIWQALPRVVKEDMPEVIQALFRPQVELELMTNAVDVLVNRWQASKNRMMPDELVDFFANFKPATEDSPASMYWIVKAWQADKESNNDVHERVKHLSKEYQDAEESWKKEAEEKLKQAEKAKLLLEKATAEKVRSVICSSPAELKKVQEMLSEDLVLKVDYKVDGKVKVLKGKSLVCTAGVVWKKFNIETAPDEEKKKKIHKDLPKLYTGKNVHLMFNKLDFDKQGAEAQAAQEKLSQYESVAKAAVKAFPSIKDILGETLDAIHKLQIGKKESEEKRQRDLTVRELEKEKEELQNQLGSAKKENADLQNQVQSAKIDNEENQNQLGSVKKENADLQNQVQSAKKDNEEKQKQLQQLLSVKEENEKMLKQIQQLQLEKKTTWRSNPDQ